MANFPYVFSIQPNATSVDVCAQNMALVAHGLLGEVDAHWTQDITKSGIMMRFKQTEHVTRFVNRWDSLAKADWYGFHVRSSDCDQEEVRRSSGAGYECEIILSADLFFQETRRIEDDYKAAGIPDTEAYDYAEVATERLLQKLERLAQHLGIEDCEMEDQNDSCAMRVALRFGNRADMDRYMLYIAELEWCVSEAKE